MTGSLKGQKKAIDLSQRQTVKMPSLMESGLKPECDLSVPQTRVDQSEPFLFHRRLCGRPVSHASWFSKALSVVVVVVVVVVWW